MLTHFSPQNPDPQVLFQNFAFPYTCAPLAEIGLHGTGWYTWRQYTDTADWELCPSPVGHNNVFSQPMELPEGITAAPFTEIPAWTMADLMRISPELFLSYISSRQQHTPQPPLWDNVASRMAKRLYEAIQCKQIFLEDANAALAMHESQKPR